ncbi:MAG TPA: dicarboxylate/amino acid:cation symporter [Candidatus Ozemobacteraceae bacterium]|nr:dicarboxylate/amino acid:cation symporter [Candidatus Ozemobacteraceae bacterium]
MVPDHSSTLPRPMPLHTRICLGLLAGGACGVGANVLAGEHAALHWLITRVTEPVGQIFLRLMVMVVVPLVFSSLTLGVAGLGNLRQLGRIGLKTLALFLLSTAIAAGCGLLLVNTIRPGVGLADEVKTRLIEQYGTQSRESLAGVGTAKPAALGLGALLEFIPRNPLAAAVQGDMLALIVFSLLVGIALTGMPKERAQPLLGVLTALADAMVAIIDLTMRLAPFGIAALIFSVTARFGIDLLYKLGWYVFTVVTGLFVHQFVVFSLALLLLARLSPWRFFTAIESIILTAFSSSSSNATLPTTMRIAEEEVGIPREICGFVLPLGATMNMNGTALFEGVTVLFLAQVFGVSLSLTTQLLVVWFCVLSAIGTAGVPGGTIPLLIMVLQSVQVPGEGIALIMGVDRLLDMCRTTVNVTGDVVVAAIVTRSENLPFRPYQAPPLPTAPE